MLGTCANSEDQAQMQHSAAFDQGQQCLLMDISVKNILKNKITHQIPETRNGLI